MQARKFQESNGILQSVPKDCRITPANVTDRNGAILAFEQNKDELTEIKSYFM